MKIYLAISLLLIFSINSLAQKNYKGLPKYPQPKAKIFPENTEYIFNQKLDDDLETKLNKKIDELFAKHNVAGITATILIPEKGMWNTNRGFISKPDNISIDTLSVFSWLSVGKLVTSTIIHQLILENKLSFNDKLSQWYPDIQYSNKITIEKLLNHTNGIYSFNTDPAFQFSNKDFSPEELIKRTKTKKNLFKPGEHWSYTNTGYLLLALIIEKIESKTFSQVVYEKISKPLNLKTLKASEKKPSNLALAHAKDSIIIKDSNGPLGAGNIISNSEDIAVFFSSLLKGKIIPIDNVHAMMENLYPMFGNGQYYGKGIMLYNFKELNKTNEVWIGHSGGTENYRAIILYDTKSKIIMTISINENIPTEAVAGRLLELIQE